VFNLLIDKEKFVLEKFVTFGWKNLLVLLIVVNCLVPKVDPATRCEEIDTLGRTAVNEGLQTNAILIFNYFSDLKRY